MRLPFHFCRSMFYSRRALSSLVLPGTSTKKWWRFDDAVVTPLDEAKIGIEKEPKKNKKKGAALPEGYCYQKKEREGGGERECQNAHTCAISPCLCCCIAQDDRIVQLVHADLRSQGQGDGGAAPIARFCSSLCGHRYAVGQTGSYLSDCTPTHLAMRRQPRIRGADRRVRHQGEGGASADRSTQAELHRPFLHAWRTARHGTLSFVYIVLIVLASGNLCAHQLVAVFASTEGVQLDRRVVAATMGDRIQRAASDRQH